VVPENFAQSFTAFDGHECLATGPIEDVAIVVKRALEDGAIGPVLIFDNATGRTIDINTQGTEEAVLAQLGQATPSVAEAGLEEPEIIHEKSRGRGRPKLGVIAREVTLLPRHWAWLADQPGGASVALRKLVEKARKESVEKDDKRSANERAYHFMSAMAGDLPGFEETCRALFAGDQNKFTNEVAGWPADIRNHASWLAFGRVRVQS
jgi:hypothetical protein